MVLEVLRTPDPLKTLGSPSSPYVAPSLVGWPVEKGNL